MGGAHIKRVTQPRWSMKQPLAPSAHQLLPSSARSPRLFFTCLPYLPHPRRLILFSRLRPSPSATMVSFKSFLVVGLTTALLLVTVVAAQGEEVPDKYVAETSSSEGSSGAGDRARISGDASFGYSPPRPSGRCRAFLCGTYTRTVWARVFYSWYSSTSLSPGSSVSDGGTVLFCRRSRWCRRCYRCIVYKWIRTTTRLPRFCCWRRGALGGSGAGSAAISAADES